MGHNLKLKTQKYSEEELEKHADSFNELDWYYISYCQVLSEKFIEKYYDNIYWDGIARFQDLSDSFIEKHKDKLNVNYLMKNKNISEEIKQEINLLKKII